MSGTRVQSGCVVAILDHPFPYRLVSIAGFGHEAHTRLITDSHDIAAAGHAVGYESPTQFSRE